MTTPAEAAKQDPPAKAEVAGPLKAQPAAGTQQPSKAVVEEKQTNCLGCGKPIRKLKRYYRDGKFYCNKKCWRKAVTDKEKEKDKGK